MSAAYDFRAWAEEKCKKNSGVIFQDKEESQNYVPYPSLQQYWTKEKINQVLAEAGLDSISVDRITRHYLRVFSILVFISKGMKLPYLQRFTRLSFIDTSLPLTENSHNRNLLFASAGDEREDFAQFDEHQFKFNHIQFTGPNDHKLNHRMILPLAFDRWLISPSHGRPTVALCSLPITKVTEVTGLARMERTDSIVVKICDLNTDEESFGSEKEAYTAFENHSSRDDSGPCSFSYDQYFLRYYGSLLHGKKGLLFVEYANQGSLDQFFNNNRPPQTFDELISFWKSFDEIFVGLHWLHGGGGEGLLKELENVRGNLLLKGVHQDVKPANIFVFVADHKQKYTLRLKIGDLGSSSVRVVRRSTRGMDAYPENQSTKMYSAPELFNPYPDMALGTFITKEADIWSLGCVMLEAVVWSICGEDGLTEFFDARQKGTERRELKIEGDKSYSAAFHNGDILLPEVDSVLATMLGRRRIFDNVTEDVVGLLKSNMLVSLEERGTRTPQRIRRELGALLLARSGGAQKEHIDTVSPLASAIAPASSLPESPPPVSPPPESLPPVSPPPQDTSPGANIPDPRSPPRAEIQQEIPRQESVPATPSTSPPSSSARTAHSDEKLPLNMIIRPTRNKISIPEPQFKTQRAKKIMCHMRDTNNKQIFIIHDSSSIRSSHWERVTSAFAALTYLLEKDLGVKSDNFRLHLTSRPKPEEPLSKKPDEQRLTVAGALPTSGGAASETANGLAQIIAEIARSPSSKDPAQRLFSGTAKTWRAAGGMDIYILTDGVWVDHPADPSSVQHVDLDPLEREIDALAKLLPKAKLSIRMILVRDDDVVKRLDLSGKFASLSRAKAWSFSHCLYDWTDAWAMLTSGEE